MIINNSPKIIGIAGSVRSKDKYFDRLRQLILQSKDVEELKIGILESEIRFANSDIALAYALFAAHQGGATVDILSLREIFQANPSATAEINGVDGFDHLRLDLANVERLFEKVRWADGVILSTPVYFGDRSSVANKFFQLTNRKKLLEGKVFGVIAVGAKRNGGQETTCIYCLTDSIAQYALAVGNGPVTSQYGGTVVAGDLLTALDDDWGLARCMELGRRVAHTSLILAGGMSLGANQARMKIKVLMTMDTEDKRFHRMVEEYFASYVTDHDIDIIDLTDDVIKRCVACGVCPKHGKSFDEVKYNCIIQNSDDCVVKAHARIKGADMLIVAGVNASTDSLIHRYQAFTERTRCMRRDNYQLSNIPLAGLLINDPSSNNNMLHNMKVITSYIRHNMIVVNPIQIVMVGGEVIYSSDFEQVLSQARAIRDGRRHAPELLVSYDAEGYSNKSQDGIAAAR